MLLAVLIGCGVQEEPPSPDATPPEEVVAAPEAQPPADAKSWEAEQVACDVNALVGPEAGKEGTPTRAALDGDATGRVDPDAEVHLTGSVNGWVHVDSSEMPEEGPQGTGWIFAEKLTTNLRPTVKLHAEPAREAAAQEVTGGKAVRVEKCSGPWLYVVVPGSVEGWLHADDHCPTTLVPCEATD